MDYTSFKDLVVLNYAPINNGIGFDNKSKQFISVTRDESKKLEKDQTFVSTYMSPMGEFYKVDAKVIEVKEDTGDLVRDSGTQNTKYISIIEIVSATKIV